MVIMVIMLIRVASVKSLIGILTHQGHISKVNANADSLSKLVTLITSRVSCDAKKRLIVSILCAHVARWGEYQHEWCGRSKV